jgi:hypothetical protein
MSADIWRSIAVWLAEHANILTVVGALILFFNWVISNTLKSRYETLKSRIEQAERDNRIDSQFAEIRESVNGITTEVLKPRGPSVGDKDVPRSEIEYWEALNSMAQTQLSATQVNKLHRFCVEEWLLLQSSDTTTKAAAEVQACQAEAQRVYKQLSEAFDQVHRLVNEVHVMNPRTEPEVRRVISAVDKLESTYRNDILPKVAPLGERATRASNQRRREIHAEVEQLGWRTKLFSKVALWLYVLGSVVALAGQASDKLLPKPSNEPNKAQSPSEGIAGKDLQQQVNHQQSAPNPGRK